VTAVLAELGEHPGLEERFHQRQHTLVLDARPHPFHDERARSLWCASLEKLAARSHHVPGPDVFKQQDEVEFVSRALLEL
jgi:hypothetical protein